MKSKVVLCSVLLCVALLFSSVVAASSYKQTVYLKDIVNLNGGECGRSGNNPHGFLDECNTARFTGYGPAGCSDDPLSGCLFWDPGAQVAAETKTLSIPFGGKGTLRVWTGDFGGGSMLNEKVDVYINGQKVGTTKDPHCNNVNDPNCHITGPARTDFFNVEFEKGVNSIAFDSVDNAGSHVVHKYRVELENDGRCEGFDIPSEMEVGQTYEIEVTMSNDGSTDWTKDAEYKLGSSAPRDNFVWQVFRVELENSDTIQPGQEKTFTFDVVAPDTPGTYSNRWEMVQEGVEWFGQVCGRDVEVVDTRECEPGDTRELPCGNCGTQDQLCNSAGEWEDVGGCDGQGPCTPGDIIEDLQCDTGEPGQCGPGTFDRVCQKNCYYQNTDCEPLEGPEDEVCDNEDNDCDGDIDEGLEEDECEPTCEDAGFVWTGNGGSLNCCGDDYLEDDPYEVYETLCDGHDNDCDGYIDENLLNDCTDYNDCSTFKTCDACAPPPPEVCDGVDNDCDGVVDEGCDCIPGDTRYVDCGNCGQQRQECDSTGTWDNVGGCAGQGPCAPGDTQSFLCDTGDPGLCQEGEQEQICTDTCDWIDDGGCEPLNDPGDEVCDELDNDCDGNTDENCQTCVGDTIPDEMATGSTETVSVTVLNDGSIGWTKDANYKLMSQNPGYNTIWGLNRVEIEDGVVVGQNQQYQFIFNITAPDLPGTYPSEWRMFKEGAFWFLPPNCGRDVYVFETECTPGETEELGCGNCGTKTRTCQSDGSWGDFSACEDQGVCEPGTVDVFACDTGEDGVCGPGTQTRTCTDFCEYETTECVPDEGPSDEVCDDVDNDCDGDTDENCQVCLDDTIPYEMDVGETQEVSVTVRNDGSVGWTAAENYKLMSQNPGYNTIWGLNRVPIEDGVVVGQNQQYQFIFNITAPNSPGVYPSEWRMFKEGAFWFLWPNCGHDVTVVEPDCDNPDECPDECEDQGHVWTGNGGSLNCCGDDYGEDNPYQYEEDLCDDHDNDCDGEVDEGCEPECINGETRPCGSDVGECEKGIETCYNDEWGPCEGEVGPEDEVCDGKDNDCDHEVDEGYTQEDCQETCEDAGYYWTGHGGSLSCCGDDPLEDDPFQYIEDLCDGHDNDCDGYIDEGLTQECTDYDTCQTFETCGNCDPVPYEVCNGEDDDCDGEVDEGFDQDGDGYTTCGGDCDDTDVEINPDAEEICDGVDNDCDGYVDEGCECTNGETRYCGTDVGECERGEQTCYDGQWGPCDDVGPEDEVCDGKDNDCDHEVDEGYNEEDCQEVCEDAGFVWSGNGGSLNCCGDDYLEDDPYQVYEDLCDGRDNDCDGYIDEGLTNHCTNYDDCSTYETCGDCEDAPDEICDGVDNDCDGYIDEGDVCNVGCETDIISLRGDGGDIEYVDLHFSGESLDGDDFESYDISYTSWIRKLQGGDYYGIMETTISAILDDGRPFMLRVKGKVIDVDSNSCSLLDVDNERWSLATVQIGDDEPIVIDYDLIEYTWDRNAGLLDLSAEGPYVDFAIEDIEINCLTCD